MTGALPACTDADPRVMDRNCSRSGRAATAGNLDYMFLYLPAGTVPCTSPPAAAPATPTSTTTPSNWATTTAYTAKSTNSGNTESITVTNTTAGYRYISLYAKTAFSGVTVTTAY